MPGVWCVLFYFVGFTLLIGLPRLLVNSLSEQVHKKRLLMRIAKSLRKHYGRVRQKLGIVTCFILLSFYSVVGGWILLYLWNAITGRLWEGNGAYEATFG